MIEKSYTIGQTTFACTALEPALYLVATPIGNLRDITIRALETLASCDVLACEDTRTSRVLLNRYGISKKLFAYHDHNADVAGPKLIAALEQGKSVALISDAGTPLVSDPGYRLVMQMIEAGHRVVPIPGASSVMTSLMAAGLATDEFTFAGFLPTKDSGRKTRFESFAQHQGSVLFFDSPKRIAASLKVAEQVFGPNRQGVVARELTKTFETFQRGPLAELSAFYADEKVKGEIVLLIGPAPKADTNWTDDAVTSLLIDLAETHKTSAAAAEAAKLTGLSKGALYKRLLDLKG